MVIVKKGLIEAHGRCIHVGSNEGQGSRLLARPPRDVASPVFCASAGDQR